MAKPKKANKKHKNGSNFESWEGLGNQPRHENLAKIRDFGLFEQKEINKNKTVKN